MGDDRRLPERLVLMAFRFRTARQLRRLSRLSGAVGDKVSFAVLGDAEPSRFWIYRKLFNREGVFHDQMHELQATPLTFTVQLGDMVSKGTVAHYEDFFRGLRRVWSGRPYITVIGNHDRSRPNGKSHSTLYRGLFGKPNYFFDHAGVRFVVLDSSAKRVSRTQLKWLKMALDVPGRKIVFTHMPPVQLSLWGGVGRVHELGGFIGGAREFAEIVSAAKVSRVYMGHVHAFGVQDHGGVRYVLTGGGGSALFPSGNDDRFHHYLTVEISATAVRDRVHTLDGKTFAIPHGLVLRPTYDEKKRRWWELV
jgi:predicted phosphodiesterase